MTVTVGSLCTGVAGLDLGLHAAYGGDTRLAWYAEVDPDARKILAVRLPGVTNLGDLTAVDWTRVPRIDVLTAGFPCQPVSAAGKQKGDGDQRWLWPHVRACYRALRPQELVFENVRNLVSIRNGELFARICDDLRADGYAVRWATAGACAVGGCHHRHRVFIVARYAWQLDAPAAQRINLTECGARRNRARTLLTSTATRYGDNQQAHLLLPTPTTSDGMGGPGGAGRDGGDNLRTVAAELPDPEPAPAPLSLLDGGRHELLPTPLARDGRGGTDDGVAQQARRDSIGVGGPSLPDVVQQTLLPTPALLPTPTVGDARNSRNATAGRAAPSSTFPGAYTLCDVTHLVDDRHALLPADGASALLPTPRHTDAEKGSPNQHGSRPGDLMLPSAVIGARYGRYAAAVALWAQVSGADAPEPTIRNRKGQWRLNPQLPEWMMGYPRGWITDLVGRSAALRGAGNGVVPQVVAAVYPLIVAGWRHLPGGELCLDPIDADPIDPRRHGHAGTHPRPEHLRPEQLTLC